MGIDNIEDITPRVQYTASASQTEFDYPFPIFAEEDVVVDVDGVVQTLSSDYTVSGVGVDTGGTITLTSALSGGEIVTVYRDTAIERTSDFGQNGPFSSSAHNDELDRITIVLQELRAQIGRAIRFPFSAETTNAQALLSPLSNWLGKLIRISSTGVPEPVTIADLDGEALTQELIGETLYPVITAESNIGDIVVNPYMPYKNILRYGASTSDAVGATNHTAISNAIAVASAQFGGEVVVPAGEFKVNDQIQLPRGVHLVGAGGGSSSNINQSVIRYIGTTFQDFITNVSGQQDQIQLRRLMIAGGEFQQGKARWVVRFTAFNRGCLIEDCEIRDGVGLLRIDNGFYGRVTRNLIQIVTPSQAASGVSDAEFAEVFGSSVAPVMLDMNGADCSANIFNKLVAEESTGAQPIQAILVRGQNLDCTNWIIETTGVDFDVHSPRMNHMIRSTGYAKFDGLYVEAVDAQLNLFQFDGEAIPQCYGFSIYNSKGTTLVNNQAMNDACFRNGLVYRADYERAWFANVSGLGAGGDVRFSNVSWRSGEPSGDSFDTFGTSNPHGAADSTSDGTYVRFHNQRLVFPRVVSGLVVTNASDGNGDYIQVTGGVLLSERNEFVVSKARSNNDTSVISTQRLRPQTASKWYRVWVGKVGNIFLTQHDTEPTDPLGDWLAEFQTDGSVAVFGLAANPRLSLRGRYIPGADIAEMSFSSVPTDTDKRYKNGDRAINNDPAAGEVPFWVFDSSETAWIAATKLPPSTAYTPTNDVTDRAFDADGTTTAEVADVVATLIKDLGYN